MARKKLTEQEKIERKAKIELKKRLKSKDYRLKRSYDENMKAIERGDIREPTYFFKRGDRVEWGYWDMVKVLEVLENGKLYKCIKVTPNIKYGRRIGIESVVDYCLWSEIRPYKNNDENTSPERVIEDDDIHFSYQQRDISSIIHLYYLGSGLDLNPDYQRELVWTEKQKVDLIESIFKSIDIGKFTIIRRSFLKERQRYYEVLDGKQRIQAILDFYECRFKYKGMTYNDLHIRDRNHFKGYAISWAETEPLTKEQKYRYFLKLNTGGVPISKEHLNKINKMWAKEKEDNR